MTTEPTTIQPTHSVADAGAAPPKRSPASSSATPSKSDTVIKLLLRARGATPLELIAATDWQAHSVRAFLSGLRKKGRTIVREARKGGEFAYRIVIAHAPAASPPPEGPLESATGGDMPNDTAQA